MYLSIVLAILFQRTETKEIFSLIKGIESLYCSGGGEQRRTKERREERKKEK